jgi:hypothetical protein
MGGNGPPEHQNPIPSSGGRRQCLYQNKSLGHVYLGRILYTERGAQERNQSCFDEELCESRWITREWILQERLLSRRIVYFGKRQLYWECQKKFKNEDGSPSFSDDLINHQSAGLVKRSFVENLLFGTLVTKWATSTFKASGGILSLLKD